jgi:hypothetical protein
MIMGRYTTGINGPVVGKIGSVIGSSRNGVPYLKGPYKNRTKKVSKEEMANRNKFALAQQWLKPLLKFVRIGFKGYSARSEGFVSAKSLLLKNSFEGDEDNRHINPALVQVSFGTLPLPATISAGQITDSGLAFTWDPNVPETAHAKDQVMMLAYDIENKNGIINTTGQFRSTGADILPIPKKKEKNTYHIYASFISADRDRQSVSIYLGTREV